MTKAKKTIILKPGRDKSVLARHPWVFSGAVDRVEGNPGSGESVVVRDASGLALGWAAYSPVSSIRARMWNLDPAETVDTSYFERRIRQAIERRSVLVPEGETNALRLVHGESDGLPGLVVDRYADVLVVQLLTAGAEFWREVMVEALVKITGVQTVVERSDVDVRSLEGLEPRSGMLRGDAPGPIEIAREWAAVSGGCGQRAENRLLYRPAAQPPTGRSTGSRAGCAQLLLLHRRF